MADERRYAYVGIRPCGCCVAACVDVDPKRSAKFTGDLIRRGYTVERHPTEWVRENLRQCDHKQESFL
jgi:hypothetical protein